jgi:two-component system, chemotaxis family, CheB/CheR fusion protein
MKSTKPSKDKYFYIVGIGASAGGLEALEKLFDSMPEQEELAFIIIQHLSPDYKSLMGELLEKHTNLSIYQVEDGTAVEPRSIYLIPRKKNMYIYQGKLFLTPQEQGLNLPIDIFLESLAEDQAEKGIAVILSGTGSDGTRGIRSVKENGGFVIVQDETTAKFDGMPKSAISTEIVDSVLPPEEIGKEIKNFITGTKNVSSSEKSQNGKKESDLTKAFMLLKRKTGVDLSYYKESTLFRRIERRMGINQIEDFPAYIRFLEKNSEEINILFKEILIGVTRFFRDKEAFDFLENQVIPSIVDGKNREDSIRIWVAGCSTGEEAYSIAILLYEYMQKQNIKREIKIFATDIDRDAIEFASFGMYPESIAADAPKHRLQRFFVKKGDYYQIIHPIREMVIFAYHNVFKDPPFRRVDLISCRNLLIYLQPVLQKKILSNFHFALNPKGYLVLGSSETLLEYSKFFDTLDHKWKIFSTKGLLGPERNVPLQELSITKPYNNVIKNKTDTDWDNTGVLSQEIIFEQLINALFAPCILIDSEKQITHIFGDINPFFQLPTGKVNFDIIKMARKEIQIPLGNAIDAAASEHKMITYNDIIIGKNTEAFASNITVIPIKNSFGGYNYAIIFEKQEETPGSEKVTQRYSLEESVNQRIRNLENELQHTKENLQATIEELETSNEELQATNEELLSSNEELQSTNEELQSVNEELITVNAEYQKKIEELSNLNDDINNLLSGSDVGTLFLDTDLTIRKFTPAAAKHIRIIKSDAGRPISDLSHSLEYPEFIDDINRVMNTNSKIEKEIKNKSDEWLLIKIHPYKSNQSTIEGIVITLIDITKQKEAEIAMEQKHELLMKILESSPIGKTMINLEGKITFANKEAEKILGIKRDELRKMQYNAAEFKITDTDGNPIPDEQLPFNQIIKTGNPVHNFEHYIEFPNGNRKKLQINGNPIISSEGNIDGAVFAIIEQ